MADQTDLILKIWDALLTPDEPEGWRDAPIIDRWSLESPNERELAVAGLVSGSDRFPNGRLRTSALRSADVQRRFVVTQNSTYRLGWPERASLEADAQHVWPPVLAVAACANWTEAISDAAHFTGRYTLPDPLLTNLEGAAAIGEWPARWGACMAIAEHLHVAGRRVVAEAWSLLGCDLTEPADRNMSAASVAEAGRQARGMYERALTVDEALAVNGWRLLGTMDDAQVEKLPREGVATYDPIAAAHKVALIALRVGSIPQKINIGQEPPAPEGPADGIVVLKSIGGIDTSWSGREVRKVFEPIVGKRLPVTPVPDVAAAYRTLAAEFPYAAVQIKTLLDDLAVACRFLPTLLVGPPGNGKSRLARRLGEISGLHVVRFDGAGASDSAFGGTPRRWSTSEPSVPAAALLAARRADALILLDEIEKGGTSSHNGNFANSLLPFLENETAARFPDPYVGEVDLSRVSYIATCNDELLLPKPLRDRFRLLRIPVPTIDDLQALCRGIVADLVRDSGSDPAWFPPLEADELDVVAQLWNGGSVRRLRDVVSRLIVKRADMPRH